ncbi:hypothetical protein [Sphingomicrobium sediminis]|uniref:Uncharacterized protein n=1 Tax=Sphingomicrobium sediminis TaxID=2950949 RepID=A0A9X2EH25_9SPHN|nr:hypothetical protein [Sphingomicrobium sediminis]MCM8557893.1 hypothetical protein [Sphingomicrobium sediminis]
MDHDLPLVLAIAMPAILFVIPAILTLMGWSAQRGRRGAMVPRVSMRRIVKSILAFVIAFNLAFLLQELGLVIPKAFVPGLDPILYHDNHGYTPADPIADLLQGGGLVALLLGGIITMAMLQRSPPQAAGARLFLTWLTFWCWMMALIQLPMAVIDPGSDVGMALATFELPQPLMIVVALVGLLGIPMVAKALVPDFLAVGPQPVNLPTRRLIRLALLPAFVGLGLVTLYRLPGDLDRVLVFPAVTAAVGLIWVMALGWMIRPDERRVAHARNHRPIPFKGVAIALVLLAVFQLVLRPGIPF